MNRCHEHFVDLLGDVEAYDIEHRLRFDTPIKPKPGPHHGGGGGMRGPSSDVPSTHGTRTSGTSGTSGSSRPAPGHDAAKMPPSDAADSVEHLAELLQRQLDLGGITKLEGMGAGTEAQRGARLLEFSYDTNGDNGLSGREFVRAIHSSKITFADDLAGEHAKAALRSATGDFR